MQQLNNKIARTFNLFCFVKPLGYGQLSHNPRTSVIPTVLYTEVTIGMKARNNFIINSLFPLDFSQSQGKFILFAILFLSVQ
jgi:hypothetical protein